MWFQSSNSMILQESWKIKHYLLRYENFKEQIWKGIIHTFWRQRMQQEKNQLGTAVELDSIHIYRIMLGSNLVITACIFIIFIFEDDHYIVDYQCNYLLRRRRFTTDEVSNCAMGRSSSAGGLPCLFSKASRSASCLAISQYPPLSLPSGFIVWYTLMTS